MPMGRGLMQMDRAIRTALSVTAPSSGASFCVNSNLTLSAHINPGTPGFISFVLWTSNVASTSYGSGAIDGSGNASVTISSGTLISGTTYYVQATYPGSGSYLPQSTPSGTSGTPIHATNAFSTTTSVVNPGSFCAYNNEPITVHVTSGGGTPNGGTVTLYAQPDEGSYFALNPQNVAVSGGSATVTVTGGLNYQWTFASPGGASNGLYAVYTGDGACFGGSTSPTIDVTVFLNAINLSTPTQNGGSPVSFCKNDGGADTWSTTPTMSNGPATGNISLWSDISGTPIASSLGTFSSGTPVNFHLNHSAWPVGTSEFAYATFAPTATTGCYEGLSSLDTTAFNVVSSSTQTINIVLNSTPVSGGPYTCGTTVHLSGTVSGSGHGSIDCTLTIQQSVNGGPYSTIYTTSITDGSPNFSFNPTANCNTTYNWYAFTVGNGCYNGNESNLITIQIAAEVE